MWAGAARCLGSCTCTSGGWGKRAWLVGLVGGYPNRLRQWHDMACQPCSLGASCALTAMSGAAACCAALRSHEPFAPQLHHMLRLLRAACECRLQDTGATRLYEQAGYEVMKQDNPFVVLLRVDRRRLMRKRLWS